MAVLSSDEGEGAVVTDDLVGDDDIFAPTPVTLDTIEDNLSIQCLLLLSSTISHNQRSSN